MSGNDPRHLPTRPEIQLSHLLLASGWAFVVVALLALILRSRIDMGGFGGGLMAALTGVSGLVLVLASSGVRQNRIALEFGCFLMATTGLGWLLRGIIGGGAVPLLIGTTVLALFTGVLLLRHRAVRRRFAPQFFTERQFETMVQVVDTMIEANGQAVLNPIQVALNVDRLLAEVEADVKKEIRTVMILVEWVLPLLAFRPFPFSNLGSHARREVVARVIGSTGIFRDVARTLKMLACAGYFGSEEGMAQVGYRPLEERPRFEVIDLTPAHYPDPHLQKVAS